MSLAQAEILVNALGLYFAAGALVGLIVVAGGARRFDPDAKAMPLQARFLVFWGAMALWPLMLVKLITGARPI